MTETSELAVEFTSTLGNIDNVKTSDLLVVEVYASRKLQDYESIHGGDSLQ